ncbi:MAG: aldehyde dehydrogenase family protein, partial [Actinobacteria bacterium]|nr:aldehyde dehydrogenase family protein [Actinomycetota bacterium]
MLSTDVRHSAPESLLDGRPTDGGDSDGRTGGVNRSEEGHVTATRPRPLRLVESDVTLPDSIDVDERQRLVALVARNHHAPPVTTVVPFTGEPFVELPQCTPVDVRAVAESARQAQVDWAARSVRDRAKVVL